METYCQNPLCENTAVKEVPVSVRTPADQVRALCATCEEAYTWGVQLRSLGTEVTRLCSKCRCELQTTEQGLCNKCEGK